MLRALLALLIVAAGIGATTHPSSAHSMAAASSDAKIQAAAGLRLGHYSTTSTVRWLQRQPAVLSAHLGRDHMTIEIAYRDGRSSLILAASTTSIRVAPRTFRRSLRPLSRPAAGAARALILEPFATELSLGSHAGDPEVGALTAAGFQVDQSYDTNVTVNTMATLPQYNVVYMHTHSGVDSTGHGVLATGQPTGCGAYSSADGSVVSVGVAGSTQCYLAITSVYITLHMGQFIPNSLIFLNGCALLNSTEFVGALLNKGAGVVLSWDADATAQDDFLSAAALFNVMAQGSSVSAALQTLFANGYGTSSYKNQKATLGFRGNGAITLQSTKNGGPPAVTPTPVPPTPKPTATKAPPPPTSTAGPSATPVPPTGTPAPTDTPSPTFTPRPTATPTNTTVPANPLPSLHETVKPGSSQLVAVRQVNPQSTVRFQVKFPNGDELQGSAVADAGGEARFSFLQQASKITRRNNTAVVTIEGKSNGTAFRVSQDFKIGFSGVDVSIQPRQQAPGKFITIWVHSGNRLHFTVELKFPGGKTKLFNVITNAQGWASIRYHLGTGLKAGEKIVARADGHKGSKRVHSASSFRVT